MNWIKKTGGMAAILCLAALAACAGNEQLVGSDGSKSSELNRLAVLTQPAPEAERVSCLPFALPEDTAGNPSCRVIRVRSSGCDCSQPGLEALPKDVMQRTYAGLAQRGSCGAAGQQACDSMCMCGIKPLQGDALAHCQSDLVGIDQSGWCYVSAEQGDAAGQLLASCAPNLSQEVRYTGAAEPVAGDLALVLCDSDFLPTPSARAQLGEPCVGDDEAASGFSGYDAKEVNIHDDSSLCSSGVCVQNHFQGRASCPYGQAAGAADCLAEGSNEPVRYAVAPQLVTRQAATASICSCQCAGNGPGPYCTCPDSMQCEHLVDDLNIGQPNLAGSYCIPKGSAYDPNGDQTLCTEPNCGVAHPY